VAGLPPFAVNPPRRPAVGADIDQQALALGTEGHLTLSMPAGNGPRRTFFLADGLFPPPHRFFEAFARRRVSAALLRRLGAAGGVPFRNSWRSWRISPVSSRIRAWICSSDSNFFTGMCIGARRFAAHSSGLCASEHNRCRRARSPRHRTHHPMLQGGKPS
jgi:hypothetical protein